jgi:hypothetical protein
MMRTLNVRGTMVSNFFDDPIKVIGRVSDDQIADFKKRHDALVNTLIVSLDECNSQRRCNHYTGILTLGHHASFEAW